MKLKPLLILSVLAALGVGAAYFATRSRATDTARSETQRAPVFPTLAARANDVAEMIIKRPEMTFTIRRDAGAEGIWRVVDKANYPARTDTLRSFIIALSQLKELEQKTSRPELYAKLGVQDPIAPALVSEAAPMPQSTLVTLNDAQGQAIASAVLGNPKWGTSPGIYVRRAGEPAVWLAEGRLEVQRDPVKWTEDQFANIGAERIKSVTITHPDSQVIAISRAAQSDTLAIQDLPPGRELKDPGAPGTLGGLLSTLAFQDVASIESINFTGEPDGSPKPGPTVQIRTFDGLVIDIRTVAKDGRTWWTLAASVDESIPSQVPAPPDADKLKAPAATTLEALRKEATDMNSRWSMYVYAPVDWKARSVNQTMGEYLKDPPAASPAASPSPAAAPR